MGMPSHVLHRWSRVIATLGVVVPSVAYAQGVGPALPIPDTYATIANWATIAASFLNMLTWFVFVFLSQFLDPRFIFDLGPDGEAGGLLTVLNAIWQLSRNLMNVGFAVGLVAAAVYTVIKGDREFISNNLKNFILAVVLVNFSWFIPRVVLDVANIATATVFSIPTAMVDPAAQCRYVSTHDRECIESEAAGDGMFSCACRAVADFEAFPGTDRARDLEAADDAWDCNWAYCAKYVKLDVATSTPHGAVLNGLIVNHARLPQLAMITRVEGDGGIADLLMFILRELIVVAIHIALFFPLLALLIALAIRIPILWLTIAFMPFYFLTFVVPDGMGLDQVKSWGDKIKDMFLKAAFLPTVVAIPLSVGFLMANAGSHIEFMGLRDVGFTLIDSMGNFSQLLWVVMVLGILWSGTFMALKLMMADMPGAGAIDKIQSTGQEAGKFAAELPLASVPIPVLGNNALGALQSLTPGGIRGARAALARGGPAAAFGLAGSSDGDRIKDRARTMGDEEKTRFVDAVKNFKERGLDTRDIQRTFEEAFRGSGVQLTDTNFKEHVEKMIGEIDKSGRMISRFELQEFHRQADAYRARKGIGAPAPVPPAAGGGGGAPPPAPPAP